MTHANPEFSIIIVTYNSNEYLAKCIRALITQRNKNFEVIIVDNDSNEDLINFDNFNSLDLKVIKLEKTLVLLLPIILGRKKLLVNG